MYKSIYPSDVFVKLLDPVPSDLLSDLRKRDGAGRKPAPSGLLDLQEDREVISRSAYTQKEVFPCLYPCLSFENYILQGNRKHTIRSKNQYSLAFSSHRSY